MSRAQAEPAPDRNAPEPSIDDVLAMHWEQMQGMHHPMVESGIPDVLGFVQGSASVVSCGYGIRPWQGLASRRRRGQAPAALQMPRPQTGHVIIFPSTRRPGPWARRCPRHPSFLGGPAIPPEVMQAALEEGMDAARTVDQLMAMQALPLDAIQRS